MWEFLEGAFYFFIFFGVPAIFLVAFLPKKSRTVCPQCGCTETVTIKCVAEEDVEGKDSIGVLGLISEITSCASCGKRLSKIPTGKRYGFRSATKKETID